MKVTATVTRKKGKRTLAQYTKTLINKVERSLVTVAGHIHDESQKLVPPDTEALKISGRYYLVSGGLDAVAAVGYGGIDATPFWSTKYHEQHIPKVYAVYVHEDTTKHHDQGQAKFLEQPCRMLPDLNRVLKLEMSR